MKTMIAGVLALGLSAACLTGAAPAGATSLKYNNFMPPKSLEAVYVDRFFKELKEKTDGAVTAQVLQGGQLLGGNATLAGIGKGVVDAGFIVPTLNPSELPNASMLPELLPFATNFWAATGASNESLFFTCPDCAADYEKQNTEWLGGYSASPWYLMCRDPLNSLADMQGRRVRVTGAFATRMIAALGGVAGNLPPGEIGPALQRRQIDCATGNLAWLTTLGLLETVTTVVDYPLGSYHGLGLFVFNRDSLKKLPADQKAAVMDLIPTYLAAITQGYADQEAEALAAAKQKGITFWKPSDDFVSAYETYRKAEVDAVAQDMKARGVENPKPEIEAHLAALDKWNKLAEQNKVHDAASLEPLLRSEIYDKLNK